MPIGFNRNHYERIGRNLYAAGILIFFSAPTCWQEKARQDGYKAARDEWLARNPGSDEWDESLKRNRAFCLQVLNYDNAGIAFNKRLNQ